MLDAEISPAGTVTVEGHHVGELQGFRFTADQTAAGEDAKAVRTAAQKALATEFDQRAEKFATAGNSDFALASDGILRWIGAPVGTLAASEDVLKPRVILLVDEQLTGAARDKVAARAERYVHYQIESQLKPLVDLKNADQLTGIARGIAFRLVENFGLVNRRDIADDVKALDQDGRAALRRLGVRFGAYHIFIPALVKPAPASLVTLLWALQNDGKDKPGFGDVVHALATGRTSVLVNASFDPNFYRLAGYRVLGRRAVRVDILERLADLIRPALSWRAGIGKRPDGAYDGAAFIVTPPMMSILGATADDIEDILKGLGYRAEPKPAADVKAKLESLDDAYIKAESERLAKAEAARAEAEAVKAQADAQAQEAVATSEPAPSGNDVLSVEDQTINGDIAIGTQIEAPDSDSLSEAEVTALESAPAETVDDDIDTAPSADETAGDDTADEVTAVEEPAEPEVEAAPAAIVAEDAEQAEQPLAAGSDQAPGEHAVAEEEAASTAGQEEASVEPVEAPKPILLWRPARSENRPRHQRDNRHRGREQGQRHPGQRQEGQRQPGQPQDGAPREGAAAAPEGKQRFDRRFKGKPGDFKGKPNPGGNGRPDDQQARAQDQRGKPDHRGKHQGKPNFQQKPREERPVRFDPDSPFAKLAALRDQLRK